VIEQWLALFADAWALTVPWLALPTLPYIAGGVACGLYIGVQKRGGVLREVGAVTAGAGVGAVAGFAVWALQLLLTGGV